MAVLRMTAEQRKRSLEFVAVEIAKQSGLSTLTWQVVAQRAGVSEMTVRRYFGTRDSLWRFVLGEVPSLRTEALRLGVQV